MNWRCIDCGMERDVRPPSKAARIKRCLPCSRRFVGNKNTAAKATTFECLTCGRNRTMKRSAAAKRTGFYCSQKCAAARLRQTVVFRCQFCHTERELPPADARTRKFCSYRCASRARAFRFKGIHPVRTRNWLRAMRSDGFRKRISEIKSGRVCDTPLTERGSQHHQKARHFLVRSPENMTYRVRGIANFVRGHPQLFMEADLLQKQGVPLTSYTCNATYGLGSLVRNAHRRNTWKGWVLVNEL